MTGEFDEGPGPPLRRDPGGFHTADEVCAVVVTAKELICVDTQVPYLPHGMGDQPEGGLAAGIGRGPGGGKQPVVGSQVKISVVDGGRISGAETPGMVQKCEGRTDFRKVDAVVEAHPEIPLPVGGNAQYRVVLEAVVFVKVLDQFPGGRGDDDPPADGSEGQAVLPHGAGRENLVGPQQFVGRGRPWF